MNDTRSFAICLCALAGSALAHDHITVDTIPTREGDQIVIRAGYLPSDSEYTIKDNRLLRSGQIAVYEVPDRLSQGGALHGWYAGTDLLLTSDFFFATGRLDGGNFMYELAAVTPVSSGGPCVAAWGAFGAGGFAASAMSDAGTRAGRSYDAMIGGHAHNQGYAFSAPGMYDLTFVAWDSNGVYLDSEPVTVRFQIGPATCPVDFDGDGFVSGIDFDLFVAAFESGDPEADFDHDGFLTGIDFDLFVAAFEQGC